MKGKDECQIWTSSLSTLGPGQVGQVRIFHPRGWRDENPEYREGEGGVPSRSYSEIWNSHFGRLKQSSWHAKHVFRPILADFVEFEREIVQNHLHDKITAVPALNRPDFIYLSMFCIQLITTSNVEKESEMLSQGCVGREIRLG